MLCPSARLRRTEASPELDCSAAPNCCPKNPSPERKARGAATAGLPVPTAGTSRSWYHFACVPSLPWYRHPCVMPLAGEALAPSPSRVVRPETDSSSRRGVGQVLAGRTVSELRTPRGFRYTRTTSRTKSAWRPKKVDQVKPKCLETQERNRAAYARDPGPGSKRGQLDTVLHSLTLPPPPLPCAPCILQSQTPSLAVRTYSHVMYLQQWHNTCMYAP